MKCPNCGHPDDSHNDAGCFYDDGVAPCFCRTSGEEIRYPEEYHQAPSMKAWFLDREISIVAMENGKFVFETDRDESGYVTATSIDDALVQIRKHLYSHSTVRELLAQVSVEANALDSHGFKIQMTVELAEILAAIGAMQLACRHPGFAGPSRGIVEKMIGQFAQELKNYPALVELIRRGGLKEFDVTADEYFHLVQPGSSAEKQEGGS